VEGDSDFEGDDGTVGLQVMYADADGNQQVGANVTEQLTPDGALLAYPAATDDGEPLASKDVTLEAQPLVDSGAGQSELGSTRTDEAGAIDPAIDVQTALTGDGASDYGSGSGVLTVGMYAEDDSGGDTTEVAAATEYVKAAPGLSADCNDTTGYKSGCVEDYPANYSGGPDASGCLDYHVCGQPCTGEKDYGAGGGVENMADAVDVILRGWEPSPNLSTEATEAQCTVDLKKRIVLDLYVEGQDLDPGARHADDEYDSSDATGSSTVDDASVSSQIATPTPAPTCSGSLRTVLTPVGDGAPTGHIFVTDGTTVAVGTIAQGPNATSRRRRVH